MTTDLLPYDIIRKAVNGDTGAILAVVKHFDEYISRLALRSGFDKNGKRYYWVDEDMKQELIIELIIKLSLFDCEND